MRALPVLLALVGAAGCSTLSDRDMLMDAGAFSVVPIQLSVEGHEDIDAEGVVVDPASHVVYVRGAISGDLAVVDGLAAHLVRYASVVPEGELGGSPEGLLTTPGGGRVFVRLPDYDGVPVMVHIGGHPDHVYAADPVHDGEVAAGGLPRRLMTASDEAGFVLLADQDADGIEFQCLLIDDAPTVICPDDLPGEFPVDMAYSSHDRVVALLSASSGQASRLRLFGSSGLLAHWEIPGGPVAGTILVDEEASDVFVIQQNLGALYRFPVGGGDADSFVVESGPVAQALDRDTGRVFVACRDSHSVVEVDPDTGESRPILLPAAPASLAIDPAARYLFVALQDGRNVAVVDLDTGAVAEVDVGGPQHAVAVDPDLRLAYALRQGGVLARLLY